VIFVVGFAVGVSVTTLYFLGVLRRIRDEQQSTIIRPVTDYSRHREASTR